MALTAFQISNLKHLAAGGDMYAKAIMSGGSDLTLTAGAEAANAIKVTGTIRDRAAQVLVTSIPVSGAGTMTDGGNGTVKAGSASKQVWVQPDATGSFQLDVLNAIAEQNLIVAQSSNGDITMLVLTFA